LKESNFNVRGFLKWVEMVGGQPQQPHTEWEAARYILGGIIHVIHRDKRGNVKMTRGSFEHYRMYGAGTVMRVVRRVTQKKRTALVNSLLIRDGDLCSVCLLPLHEDISIEHWLSVEAGGNNGEANVSLTHAVCNQILGDRPVGHKVSICSIIREVCPDEPPDRHHHVWYDIRQQFPLKNGNGGEVT